MLEQIKERLDVADFIRGYIALSPAGKNLKGLCPFHKEKTPSFVVSPDKQIWHCFGCSKGGDVVAFAMLYENLEFLDALKLLAEKAGLDFQKSATPDQKRLNVLYDINRAAKDYFVVNLSGKPIEYLLSRGLKKETIAEFEIGFAPMASDSLTRQLIKSGFSVGDIERAGLTARTERGTYWDRFRGRIMFPLYNSFGKTVGFTGRIMPDQENPNVGKYVNSPETPIFNKSKILFGFHKSKNHIREANVALLVEGQMDFLMLWQDGIKNSVATSGTALTSDHLKVLRRLADNLIVCYDSDSAGQAATERAIDFAEAGDFVAKVLTLKEKDPADLVKSSPGEFKNLLSKSVPAVQYYLEKYLNTQHLASHIPHNFSEIKNGLRIILAKVKNIYSNVERGLWLKELEKRTGIQETLLTREMENIHSRTEGQAEQMETPQALSRKELIADQLINLAFFKKDFYDQLIVYKELLPESHIQALEVESKNLDNIVLLRSSLSMTEKEEKKASEQFQTLIRQLQLDFWKEKRQAVLAAINVAEQKNDAAVLAVNLKEFDNINKKIQNI